MWFRKVIHRQSFREGNLHPFRQIGGTLVNFSGVTGADGTFLYKYRLNVRKTGTGEYSVAVSASLRGYTDGSGATTFFVQ